MAIKFLEFVHKIKAIIKKHGSRFVYRSRKSNEIDALLFYCLHCHKDVSMDTTSADLNDLNSRYLKRSHISRQSLSSRAANMPESFYQNVCFDISQLIDKYYYSRNNYSYEIIAVDGSDCNLRKANAESGFNLNKKGQSITALNLGVYNVTRNYPVDISLVKHSNERKAFLDFINQKRRKTDFSNSIFVFDRGFDGASFLNKLEDLGLKYICRLRSTLNLINPDIDDSIQDLKDNKTTRIVKYVIGNKPYYLATNLYDETEFSIVKLKQLYHKRWTVEEAFKYIKRNFNFGLSELKSADAIRKSICCQVIIMKLTNILACIGRKKIIITNKQCNRNNIKDNRIINKSTITHGLFNHLLFVIFNDVLSRRAFNNFLTNYIVLITTNKGKRALHICITPYFKWFFKQHTINANKQKAAKAAKKAAKKVAEKID